MDKVIDEGKLFKAFCEASIETITNDLREDKAMMAMHKNVVKAGMDKDASSSFLGCLILGRYEEDMGKNLALKKVAFGLLFSEIDLKLRAEYEAEKGEEEDED